MAAGRAGEVARLAEVLDVPEAALRRHIDKVFHALPKGAPLPVADAELAQPIVDDLFRLLIRSKIALPN